MDYCKLYRFSGVQPRRALQFVFYDFENFMQDIYKMDLIGFGKNVLLYYGITVVVYGAASYLICSLRYARAKKSLKCYYNNLKKLNSIYNE